MTRLTHKRKVEFFQILTERDGYLCFYCDEDFTRNHHIEFDHLNNNPNDTRPENLVLTHHECNNKKKLSTDLQIKAQEKLSQNENTVFASERTQADTGTTDELTSSQQISKALRPIALQWLQEHLLMEKEIELKHAVNAMVHLCQEQTGWGSKPTIYRYIDEWTNPYNGQFTLITKDGKTIIRKRTEN